MSTHKHIDRICGLALAAAMLLTLLLMALPVEASPVTPGYAKRLFDTTRVHTINIVIDDWDGFLSTARSEEYAVCAVIIDGEASRNVGIRAKGNTSLTQVASYGNDRYSFKIEFDHYEDGKSYHGLDKLSLNNLIQDNTYMKDYLVYRMMGEFGVAAPLCSYAWLTVNGADWGLYLAVEGVEDGFLTRNYGGGQGDLYKPDSSDMGGGRGNGQAFDMDDFRQRLEAPTDGADAFTPPEGMQEPRPGDRGGGGMPPDGEDRNGFGRGPGGGRGGFGDGQMQMDGDFGGRGGFGGFGGGFGNGFGNSGSDVKLQYIDDDPASYPNIFGNAKTTVTAADEQRLLDALKRLSGDDPTSAVDVDAVLRYFVVHNFVCNGDSYTGSIVHNYYLYEQNGRLSMIPWDYNLAFGGFSGTASGSVNEAIDDVLSDRPMQSWIFASEASTAQYHALFGAFLQQFFSDGQAEALIADTAALIAPYVRKDPTAFCGYEDFTVAVEALQRFVALRAQSVAGQLDGGIPSTSEGQRQDASALVDTGDLDLSDMGGMGRGGGFGGRPNAGLAFGGHPFGDDAPGQAM